METSIWWLASSFYCHLSLASLRRVSQRRPGGPKSKDEYDAKSPAYASSITFNSLTCPFLYLLISPWSHECLAAKLVEVVIPWYVTCARGLPAVKDTMLASRVRRGVRR